MIHHIFPNKDATIYEGTGSMNTGLDEIIELEHGTTSGSANAVSRILTQFDLTDISASIADGTITSPSFYLKLSAIEGIEIPLDYTLVVQAVSQSWDMGFGKKYNTPNTTNDITWTNRKSSTPWQTASFADNSTGSYQSSGSAGGATWYVNIVPEYGNSVTFTGLDQNANFYVTSSDGTIYTFSTSGSTTLSSSFTNVNEATGSVLITDFSQNNEYIVSASVSASLIFVDDPFLFNDLSGSDTYYFSTSGSDTNTPSSASMNITSGKEGNQYVVNDGLSYIFIASDTPVPNDVPSARVYYFLSSTSSMADTVASMSIEINSVTNLTVSASTSGSTLQLTSSYAAGDNNNYTFTSGSTVVTFEGGLKNSYTSSITALVSQLNDISNLGLVVTASGDTLILSSSLAGLIGNDYTFTSGSTTTTLQGGTTSSITTSSFTLADDVTSTRNYYFVTGSSVSGSLYNLSNKMNDVLSFMSSVTASNTLHMTGSGNNTKQQLIGFESGSTQVLLTNTINTLEFTGSQRFNYASPDTRIDVTTIVNAWLDDNVPNDGFLVKRLSTDEKGNTPLGTIKFFSNESHTMYLPKLLVAWDDSTFVTGSLTELTDDNKVVYMSGLQKYIKVDSKTRLRVNGRPKYPARTFATSSAYRDIKFLPETSYYAVKDTVTEDFIINFDDNFTKLSCDASGNYFDLWTTGFLPERYYKIIFKTVSVDGTRFFDEGFYFKVVR